MREIRNCTVVVVGGAGFLGSHLVDHLILDRKCKVIVIDNLVVGQRKFIHHEAEFIHHDITGSEEFLKNLFLSKGVSYVFNYAALPYIPDSFKRPLRVFDINAMAALKVINAAQEAGCLGILQVSSAEIYGDGVEQDSESSRHHTMKIDEDCPVKPHSSYGAAKAAIDAMVQVRWKEAQTPVIALRQFNCVGERDTLHPYIIPEIAKQLAAATDTEDGKYIVRLGNNSTRDFQYAGDAVRKATLLLEKGHFGEVYNLGSEECIKMYDLAILIGDLMNKPCKVVQDPARIRPWEIWHLQSDNTKINSVIQDTCESLSLKDALLRTINSFENAEWSFPW